MGVSSKDWYGKIEIFFKQKKTIPRCNPDRYEWKATNFKYVGKLHSNVKILCGFDYELKACGLEIM